LPAVTAQRVDHEVGQADISPAGTGLRCLDLEAVRWVSSSASRTLITLPSRSTFSQRSAKSSPSRIPVKRATMAGAYIP
jgi:hypothetical protein